MVSYIYNGRCYLGDISFSVPLNAYVREANGENNLTSISPTLDSLLTPGVWYFEWAYIPEREDIRNVLIRGFDPPIFQSGIKPAKINNLSGYWVVFCNEDTQFFQCCFPMAEGAYMLQLLANEPGSATMAELQKILTGSIMQSVLSSLQREDDLQMK